MAETEVKPRFLRGFRMSLERNALNKRVAANANAARAHEANGIPRGHQVYKSLYENSLYALEEFGKQWDLPVEQTDREDVVPLLAQFPAMFVLKLKATPPGPAGPQVDIVSRIKSEIVSTIWLSAAGVAAMVILVAEIVKHF